MKKLLIIILFISLLIRGQNLLLFDKTNPLYALDLDGSTEYTYVNNPSGLDLNSANYLSGDNTAFTTTVGNWVGLTQTSGKATFSSNATLATSNLSTQFISGHNYTIQLKAKSGSSSALKIKCGTDSTSVNTTTTETTYAFTFTYHSGSQIELKGNGTDTYTVDDVDVSEAYDLEINSYFKFTSDIGYQILFKVEKSGAYIMYQTSETVINSIMYDGGIFVQKTLNLNKNNWNRLKTTIKPNSLITDYNGSISTTNFSKQRRKIYTSSKLIIGSSNGTVQWANGQIGWIKFTRKNGLGTIVNETLYDWKGDANNFLKDKKGTNHLTGVNVTLPDVVKYSGGKYK